MKTKTEIKPNRQHAKKIVELLGYGLCKGLGEPEPGKMCVEAAVCFAMGLEHSDEPSCVSPAVRAFKIALNDSDWSSNQARAKGLKRVAIAQLGSSEIDENVFAKELALAVVRRVLPIALRAAGKLNADHKEKLESKASACELVKDFSAAWSAAWSAWSAAWSAQSAAARSAAESAQSAAKEKDKVLTLVAECAVDALKVCKSPGCEWLDLCE